ncbi:MAG: hypothetical protein COV74_05515, partial [Candidatus Omnitrophica bacterium CG11_big_fil_rev_8_21_14_0_20_45_26]
WYLKKLHLPTGFFQKKIENLFTYSAKRKKTGVDLDDFIFLDENEYPTGVDSTLLPELLKQSHFVSTTTAQLANELRPFNSSCYVIPNAIDFNRYQSAQIKSLAAHSAAKQITRWQNEKRIVLGWVAGHAQQVDLELFHSIYQALPNPLHKKVSFLLIGTSPKGPLSNLKATNIAFTQNIPWQEFPALIRLLNGNLALLADTRFNRCKSELKVIEAGFFGVPAICSKVGIFEFIAKQNACIAVENKPQNWCAAIEHFVNEKEFRLQYAQRVRYFVLSGYDSKQRAQEYLNFFEQMIKN